MKCKICDCVVENINIFIKHVRLHRKCNSFECPISDCGVFFKSFSAYKTHLRQRHFFCKKKLRVECPDLSCTFECSEYSAMVKHVTRHISEGYPEFCPLKCRTGKPFITVNSFKIHNMYYHRRIVVQKEIPKVHQSPDF